MKRFFSLILILSLSVTLGACTAPAATSQSTQSQRTESVDTIDTPAPFDLVLTEVMPDNRNLCLGHDLDWVEIHNREETSVSLEGYYLTDDPAELQKFSLSGREISADGYLAVVLSDDAPFRLSAEGETVYLTFAQAVVSQLSYPLTEGGESHSPEGGCPYPTPGYANTEEGYAAYTASLPVPALTISEVLSSNDSYLPVNGECYDLLEVKNTSGEPVSLAGYTLSDKRKELTRYAFPDVVLEPGGFFVVYCSGVSSLGSNHAPFKISSSGETLYLAKDGVVCDLLTVPGDLKRDESFGRQGTLPVYFPEPTPGYENGTGFASGVSVPAADVPSGVYANPVTVTLSASGTVYYTLDGSRPTTASPVYEGPLTIDGVTTLRTFCVDGSRSSSFAEYTYIVGQTHQLPVVSVAIPQDCLTGEFGILNNIQATYEYEGVVTLIENGEEKFSEPFGFRLHGNGSRAMEKQNFQLRFRSEYGVGKLKYPVFENRSFDEYDSLLLKGGSEDWNSAVMRDEFCTGLAEGTTALEVQAIKPVVLYLGGQYWGIYYLRERFNDEYVASHYGVSPESVDLLYSSGGYAQAGSAAGYKEIRNFVSTHDMSLPENYAWLCERIDALSLMDWYICRSYMGDKDTANIRRFRTSEGDGKWRWMYFDLDWAFYHKNDQPLSSIAYSDGDNRIFRGLVASAEGRDLFLRRYAELMNTFLNEEVILARIDSFVEQISSEIPRDRARWGKSVSGWERSVEQMRNYVRGGARTTRVLADLQDFFGLTDAEMASYFGI